MMDLVLYAVGRQAFWCILAIASVTLLVGMALGFALGYFGG